MGRERCPPHVWLGEQQGPPTSGVGPPASHSPFCNLMNRLSISAENRPIPAELVVCALF
jgi:hypothetical protein